MSSPVARKHNQGAIVGKATRKEQGWAFRGRREATPARRPMHRQGMVFCLSVRRLEREYDIRSAFPHAMSDASQGVGVTFLKQEELCAY